MKNATAAMGLVGSSGKRPSKSINRIGGAMPALNRQIEKNYPPRGGGQPNIQNLFNPTNGYNSTAADPIEPCDGPPKATSN